MKTNLWILKHTLCGAFLLLALNAFAQPFSIRGKVTDATTGEELIGAAIAIVDGEGGALSNYDGEFLVEVPALPVQLKISYTGYKQLEITVNNAEQKQDIRLEQSTLMITETVIKGQRIDEKQKGSPLTVERLDAIAIKETPAINFYNGLGNLKGVDLTTASLGFTVINTRGFNSTNPVRSLQLIDGVDNQAPGLNFSLGNFLGASELDVNNVELIQGASSSFYGPNAFNGVIAMETKNPFLHKGVSAMIKVGERQLMEGALRYADVVKNKNGDDVFAFKLNFFGLQANDWEATNYDPITGSESNDVFSPEENPGRFDAVNIYGDEFRSAFVAKYDARAGLNTYHRTGYREVDLVDYNTQNLKLGTALHFRTNPKKTFESPELIVSSNFGTGTTVYQGDNRFSLRDILFFQNRIEFRKKDKFFIRAYATNEDAGNSFDPYFTALLMQEASKTNEQWSNDYQQWWVQNQLGDVFDKMKDAGYGPPGDNNALVQWQRDSVDFLTMFHNMAAEYAAGGIRTNETLDFFEPGTARFDSLFDAITARKNNDPNGGSRFFDKSALYHAQGEYRFQPNFLKEIVVGANVRLYRPNSDGTIFSDSAGVRIQNNEWGAYTGASKEVRDFTFSATVRVDKNQNFDLISTPAASVVWNPGVNNYLRLSFSSAIRNPTLTDQYFSLRVGPATLLGNLDGFQNLITIESFNRFRNDQTQPLEFINVDPIRPEKVRTVEIGYRTTLFEKLYIDAGYYYNFYNDFIGFNIGLTMPFDTILIPGLPPIVSPDFSEVEVLRVASNAEETVTTQGFALGMNYYFKNYYMFYGNYSWNVLNSQDADPIIPAFNTPEHKFNLGFSGRDIPLGSSKLLWGFNINYKWIDGFLFEGSPQFTGFIPQYELLDAQVNMQIPRWHSTLKIGASNLLDNQQFQVYGGPRIGRMAYVSLLYDFRKK